MCSGTPVAAAVVAVGLLTPGLVPGWEAYTTGTVNVSHALGVWLGTIIGVGVDRGYRR